jgi:hypothetical protein
MGSINNKGRSAFRDFNTDGVPASGAHEPAKSEIRDAWEATDAALTAIATVIATGKTYATKALMNADLTPAAGTLAAVYNDPTADLNGFYVKSGGTGTGSWLTTNIGFPASFAGDLSALVDGACRQGGSGRRVFHRQRKHPDTQCRNDGRATDRRECDVRSRQHPVHRQHLRDRARRISRSTLLACSTILGTNPNIQIGSSNFSIGIPATNPRLTFDVGDYYSFDVTNNIHSFVNGGSYILQLTSNAVSIFGDQYYTLSMVASQPRITYDNGDYQTYDRTNNAYLWQIGATNVLTVNTTNITYSGHVVWHDGNLDASANHVSQAAGATLTADGVPDTLTVSSAYAQMWTDLNSRWWQSANTRIWGITGGYAVDNTKPFQWAMANLHVNFYWKGKGGDSAATTKVTQNFAELLSRVGSTTMGQATIPNDVGATDDCAWWLQYLTQVHDLTANSTALTVASNFFTSTTSTFADPNSSGAGLLYTTDALSATLGHHRVSTATDIFIAISALYLYQHGGTSTHLTFATHCYSWVKQYLMHPTGVIYMELDVDPTHGAAFLTPVGETSPVQPITPHFSLTTIAGSFAFMTLCKRLNDISPNAQYITDINNMMAAILRSDTFMRPGPMLLPDRDGWSNGLGLPQFAAEVLPLAGLNATLVATMKRAIVNTALSVARMRTDNYYYNRGVTYGSGFYGADWNGPELGSNGILTWHQTGTNNGSIAVAEQIMTTGSTACVITAASLVSGQAGASQFVTHNYLAAKLQQIAQGYLPLLGGQTIRDVQSFASDVILSSASDANFKTYATGALRTIQFDVGDAWQYDRTANTLSMLFGAIAKFTMTATDMAFTGNVYGGFLKADTNMYMTVSGSLAQSVFDANDYNEFNRTSNYFRWMIGGSEKFRIDSGGFSTSGGATLGNLSVSSGTSLSGGATVNGSFTNNGSASISGSLGVSTGATINGGITCGGIIFPSADNSYVNGGPSNRWSVIYAGTGTINTSDEREKTWRGALTADELAASKEIAASIGIFQFNEAIVEKGADGARLHTGVKAQQAISIMQGHGLDPMRYAFVCYDEWEALDAIPEIEGQEYRPAVWSDPVFDEEGTLIEEPVVLEPEVPMILPQLAVPGRAAGNIYGIRYDELAMFLAAAQEQRLAALEAA